MAGGGTLIADVVVEPTPRGRRSRPRASERRTSSAQGDSMSGYRMWGFIAGSLLITACVASTEPVDPTADDTASTGNASITATVVTRNASGEQVISTETFTRGEFLAMVAARRAGPAGSTPAAARPAEPQGAGLGITQSAIMPTSCMDPNALWMWNVANGWTLPQNNMNMLCLINAGTFALNTVPGWDMNVRSIWPGNEAGGIWPGGAVGRCDRECTTPSSLDGFAAWSGAVNTPGCTTDRFVVLSDAPISCWVP
jgi:hypothetical protein